jgi:hypothetical protein
MSEQAKSHYDRFRHNFSLVGRVETSLPDDRGWSCVVMFYAALHLMSAYLILKHNVRFDPTAAAHPERKRAMDACPELRDSRKKYRELKDLSESVRYDPGFVYNDQHHADAKNHLERIFAIVEPKLKRMLGLP